MIISIRNKGLKLLWEQADGSKLPASLLRRIQLMLDAIDRAEYVPQDFLPFAGWRIHLLKGDLAGYWSLTVSANYRLIFRFWKGKAMDLDFVDYH